MFGEKHCAEIGGAHAHALSAARMLDLKVREQREGNQSFGCITVRVAEVLFLMSELYTFL